MPQRPLRPCTAPGCGSLTQSGRCARHQRVDRRPFYHQRPGAHPRWREISAHVLREEPTCRICRTAPATDVDHIIAKSRGGGDERSNLQGLCSSCHARKGATTDGLFGKPRKRA